MKLPAVAGVRQTFQFPLVAAGLMCVALLVAEHHFPADVMYESSVDLQVTGMKGSLLHQVCYLLLGWLGLIWLLRDGHRLTVRKTALVFAYVALLAWCVVSISWAEEPLVSGKRFIALFLMMIGAAGTVAYWPQRAIVAFISISTAIHLTVGLVGELAAAHFTPWHADYRFAGTLPWNEQGFCCLILALSSLAAMDMNPRYKRIFRCLFLYGVLFLVLTKSRSALMGMFVGLGIYFLLTRSSRFKLGSIFGLVLGSLLLFVTGILDNILALLSRGGEGAESLSGRRDVWEECWHFIDARPIAGYGYEDFWTTAHIDDFSQEFHWGVSAAHSGYLEALLTLGWVGLLLQVSVLLLGIWQSVVLYKRSRNPIFALAACLCALYLLIGYLEAILVVKLSPYSFYLALLLLTLCWDNTWEKEDTWNQIESSHTP